VLIIRVRQLGSSRCGVSTMNLLTLSDVCERTKYSRWTIWRHRRRYADYPRPIGQEGDDLRFVEAEIEAFYLSRRQGS
jgi:predicted DNA-binding transcriptional regulator AlpA